MVGSEQRLTGLEQSSAAMSTSLSELQANDALQDSSISILNSWITYYNTSLFPFVIYRNQVYTQAIATQYQQTGTTFQDFATLNITTLGNPVDVVFSADEFFVAHTSSATAFIAVQIDGGTDVVVYKGSNDGLANYGKSGASFRFRSVGLSAGAHTIKIRWRVSTSGATAVLGSFTANSVIQIIAMEQ
jgi:hypothetical protein